MNIIAFICLSWQPCIKYLTYQLSLHRKGRGFTAPWPRLSVALMPFPRTMSRKGLKSHWWHLISLEFLVRFDLGKILATQQLTLCVCVCKRVNERGDYVSLSAVMWLQVCMSHSAFHKMSRWYVLEDNFRFLLSVWQWVRTPYPPGFTWCVEGGDTWKQPAGRTDGCRDLWSIDMCVSLFNRGLWIFKQHQLLHTATIMAQFSLLDPGKRTSPLSY